MVSYYNEIDPYAAQWLRNLIDSRLIAEGDVDDRSIRDVAAADLRGYTQCHFFAGIGVWSHALRLAGWPDDRPVWTGSCPCQPFSAAGKGAGFADERHLWPAWFKLIQACKPPVIFGEQVASADVVGKASEPRGRKAIRDSIPAEASGAGFSEARGASFLEEGYSVRSLGSSSGAASTDRRGQVRGDGSAVQFGGRQDVGQSFSRSHRPSERLRLLECARGLSWREQRNGGLGRAATDQDGASYSGAAEAEIERLLAAFGRGADEENSGPWLDAVFHDLERAGYACGADVLPACGVGAPHIRQRLWFVGERLEHAARDGRQEWRPEPSERGAVARCGVERLGHHHHHQGLEGQRRGHQAEAGRLGAVRPTAETGELGGVADADQGERRRFADGEGRQPDWSQAGWQQGDGEPQSSGSTSRPRPTNGHWRVADWLYCRDGKWRPVEARPQPLADGSAESLGRVCAKAGAEIEEALNAAAMESEVARSALLRALRETLGAQARSVWAAGRLPGLHEAPFLLAYLRQLQIEGWCVEEGSALSREEAEARLMRVLRDYEAVAGPSHRRELEEQRARKSADVVHLLSSLLARHAQASWAHAYETYAEIGFPIGHGSPARVGRLRAYGNAIVPQAAAEVIGAYLDARP